MTRLGTMLSPSCMGADNPSLRETDYVLRNFDANFANWRGERIVLHGTREYAQAIIDEFDDQYHFEAVATIEPTMSTFSGKDVWDTKRVLKEKPDIIILTERVRHAEAVYQELGETCRAENIALFDMYGLDWLALREAIDRQSAQTLEEWLEIAQPYDVVSFEAPDCLLIPTSSSHDAPLTCRLGLKRLIARLRKRGTTVLFVGRKPYTASKQIASLEAERLIKPDEASRLFFMRAGEDGTWRTIRAAYPGKHILHIGYGIPKECILPRYYGVDTYRLEGDVLHGMDRTQLDALIAESLDPNKLRRTVNAAIDQAEIVSFDVFDTLLVRTTLTPEDVFELVERDALKRGLPARGFTAARTTAQYDARNLTIEEIYQSVQDALRLSDDEREHLKALEWEAEQSVIHPRESMQHLYKLAQGRDKRIVLVSDMHYSQEAIAHLLARHGIEGYEQLVVSSEYRTLKHQELFDEILDSSVPTSSIVHIGNSLFSDFEAARAQGMDAVLVPSPISLAWAYGYNRKLGDCATLEERCALGEAISREFDSPFKQHDIPVLAGKRKEEQGSALSFALRDLAYYAERAVVHVAPHDTRFPIELRQGLLAWYPFNKGQRALFVGSDREALAPLLETHYETLDFNVRADARYSCIVAIDLQENEREMKSLLDTFAQALEPDGVLLMGFSNRFGVKYLCGGVDAVVGTPFDTLSNETRCGAFGTQEMRRLATDGGFAAIRPHYVMPDKNFVQVVYTDERISQRGIRDRLMAFDAGGSPLVAGETDLYPAIDEEGMLPALANYIVMECRKSSASATRKQVARATLSLDRGPEHSLITTLYTDGTALKAAACPEGRTALHILDENGRALQTRGIAIVDAKLQEEGLVMPFVQEPRLLEYLDSLLPGNSTAFVDVFKQLYRDILQSSEPGNADDEALRTWGMSSDALGPILQKGYIDMIPLNAFWDHDTIRYFDQEFVIDSCPARYILFRALSYTYRHLPHIERTIPLAQMKQTFGLVRGWNAFSAREEAFIDENRNRHAYHQLYDWTRFNQQAVLARRKKLLLNADGNCKPYDTGLLMGVFDLFHIGHLRLIKRAKKRCCYLRVGVLADALVEELKGITPTIPLSQRMEILTSIESVDEVVAIEDTPSRIVEWHRRPFNCFFSGDDYEGNPSWEEERRQLEKLGATIEFFPYTEEQSSSKIRKALG